MSPMTLGVSTSADSTTLNGTASRSLLAIRSPAACQGDVGSTRDAARSRCTRHEPPANRASRRSNARHPGPDHIRKPRVERGAHVRGTIRGWPGTTRRWPFDRGSIPRHPQSDMAFSRERRGTFEQDSCGNRGRREHRRQAGARDRIPRCRRASPAQAQTRGDGDGEQAPLPDKVNQGPANHVRPGLKRRIHRRPPRCLSSSFRISASSFGDVSLAARACMMSLAAEPLKTLSSMSVTSCFCVCSSGWAAA